MTRLTDSRCLCRSCNQRFNSTYAFDRHRVGAYPSQRRCLAEDEMVGLGMTINSRGFWITEARQFPTRLRRGHRDSSGFGDTPFGPRRGATQTANRRDAKATPQAGERALQTLADATYNSKVISTLSGGFSTHGKTEKPTEAIARDQAMSDIIRLGGEP
jgi:hypothetical protein